MKQGAMYTISKLFHQQWVKKYIFLIPLLRFPRLVCSTLIRGSLNNVLKSFHFRRQYYLPVSSCCSKYSSNQEETTPHQNDIETLCQIFMFIVF